MRQRTNAHGNARAQLSTLIAVASISLIGACYKATFIRNSSAIAGGIERDEWTDFFIFGLVGSEDIDVRRFCGDAAPAMVRTGGNAGTTILSVLTIGIYTPRKVYVVCGGTPTLHTAYQIETDAHGDPSILVRRYGVHTQRAAAVAMGPSRWSARLSAGESR